MSVAPTLHVLVDSREQRPYDFARWPEITVVTGALYVGDYSLPGLEREIAVERKSLDDLVGSLSQGRERFEREMARGAGLTRFHLVIEATLADVLAGRYRSRMAASSVFGSLMAWESRYGVRVHFAGSREQGEYLTLGLLGKHRRELQAKLSACLGWEEKKAPTQHATRRAETALESTRREKVNSGSLALQNRS